MRVADSQHADSPPFDADVLRAVLHEAIEVPLRAVDFYADAIVHEKIEPAGTGEGNLCFDVVTQILQPETRECFNARTGPEVESVQVRPHPLGCPPEKVRELVIVEPAEVAGRLDTRQCIVGLEAAHGLKKSIHCGHEQRLSPAVNGIRPVHDCSYRYCSRVSARPCAHVQSWRTDARPLILVEPKRSHTVQCCARTCSQPQLRIKVTAGILPALDSVDQPVRDRGRELRAIDTVGAKLCGAGEVPVGAHPRHAPMFLMLADHWMRWRMLVRTARALHLGEGQLRRPRANGCADRAVSVELDRAAAPVDLAARPRHRPRIVAARPRQRSHNRAARPRHRSHSIARAQIPSDTPPREAPAPRVTTNLCTNAGAMGVSRGLPPRTDPARKHVPSEGAREEPAPPTRSRTPSSAPATTLDSWSQPCIAVIGQRRLPS